MTSNKRSRFSESVPFGGTSNGFGRFVIIKSDEIDSLKKLSPFVVQKSLESISTQIEKTSRMRDGSLLILVKSKAVAERFLAVSSFAGVKVSVTDQTSLNCIKGIIFCNELTLVDDSEILSELKPQFVTSVYRLKKKVNNELVPTSGLILTFDLHKIPDEIKIGFLSVKVRLYVPNPMRCYNCFSYGHTKTRCQEKGPVCSNCSAVGVHTPCGELLCINCEGNHSNFDKNCPIFLEEKCIIKIQTMNRIPYGAAKRIYENEHKNDVSSYADVAKNSFPNHQPYLDEIGKLKSLIEEINRTSSERQIELLNKMEVLSRESLELKSTIQSQNKKIYTQQQVIIELQNRNKKEGQRTAIKTRPFLFSRDQDSDSDQDTILNTKSDSLITSPVKTKSQKKGNKNQGFVFKTPKSTLLNQIVSTDSLTHTALIHNPAPSPAPSPDPPKLVGVPKKIERRRTPIVPTDSVLDGIDDITDFN